MVTPTGSQLKPELRPETLKYLQRVYQFWLVKLNGSVYFVLDVTAGRAIGFLKPPKNSRRNPRMHCSSTVECGVRAETRLGYDL